MTTVQLGTCPKCNGSGRRPVPAESQQFKTICAGYDADTDTFSCNNCGGQTMSCRGTGKVPLRPDGTPCLHEYEYRLAGRCFHEYKCRHCSHKYCIDSGD